MRKLLFLVCLAGCSLLLHAQGAAGFPFFKGPFYEMEIDATTSQKPMVLFFYTDWCGACGEMLKKTLNDASLKQYVAENYLAFKIDGESLEPDGIELAQEYGVLFYPTVIYLNTFGQELKRESGFQSASHLLGELKRYRFVKGPSTSTSSPSTSMASVSGRSITSSSYESPPPLPLQPISPTPPSAPGLYHLSVRRQDASGYGAQVGVFSDYANVLKTALELDEYFPGQILVHANVLGGEPVFKMILGPYGSRVAAQDAVDRSKQNLGKTGYVVELGNL